MKHLVGVVLMVTAGCSRCATPVVADAGAPAVVAAKAPRKFSTDLRTVLLTIYPEYRGTNVRSGVARLTRTLVGGGDWTAKGRALFAKHRATETPADAGVAASLDLFQLQLVPTEGGAEASIALPVDGETMGKLYTNPASLSSLQLGLYLPREDVTIARDVFDFHLVYDAVTERRAAFLTRQLVELMLGNGQWTVGPLPPGWGEMPPDGGYGEVPEAFEVVLTGVVDGATVRVTRDARRVVVVYRLLTFEP